MARIEHDLKLKVDTTELDQVHDAVNACRQALVELADLMVVTLKPLVEAFELLLEERDDDMNEPSTQDALGTCDTCDKPATHAARDFTFKPPEDEDADTINEYSVGGLRRGCDDHPVHSTETPVGE